MIAALTIASGREATSPLSQLPLPFPLRLASLSYSIELPPRRPLEAQRCPRSGQLDLLSYNPVPVRVGRLVALLTATQANLTRSEDALARDLLSAPLTDGQRSQVVAALVYRLDRLLVSEARRLVGDSDDLDDFAQEARMLATLALNNRRRDASRPLKPYLLGVLRRGLARTHNMSSRMIRIPERQLRRVYALWRLASRAEAARMPAREIAQLLSITDEMAQNVRVALAAIGPIVAVDDGEVAFHSESSAEDLLSAAESSVLSQHTFQGHLAALPAPHRALLAARFPPGAEARTIATAARTVGVSLNTARVRFAEIRTILAARTGRSST